MKKRLIELLRTCKSESPWGQAVRQFIDTKQDVLISQLKSQCRDDYRAMVDIVGTEAAQILITI